MSKGDAAFASPTLCKERKGWGTRSLVAGGTVKACYGERNSRSRPERIRIFVGRRRRFRQSGLIVVSGAIVLNSVAHLNDQAIAGLGVHAFVKSENVFGKS